MHSRDFSYPETFRGISLLEAKRLLANNPSANFVLRESLLCLSISIQIPLALPTNSEWVIHHIGCSDACRSVWSRASMLIKQFPCPDEDEWRSKFKGIK
ncbi:hypothetical protein CEXT_360941 [Caerostris extrusa]|uniref:SH2 domain-containing protein n=1 Tax=Caerostris extrusa TaxID=172846 RepID=A0AAV4NY18_CAEEX|nr:hypothetical protein CEXT_360941 [Caerostris extrusa]